VNHVSSDSGERQLVIFQNLAQNVMVFSPPPKRRLTLSRALMVWEENRMKPIPMDLALLGMREENK